MLAELGCWGAVGRRGQPEPLRQHRQGRLVSPSAIPHCCLVLDAAVAGPHCVSVLRNCSLDLKNIRSDCSDLPCEPSATTGHLSQPSPERDTRQGGLGGAGGRAGCPWESVSSHRGCRFGGFSATSTRGSLKMFPEPAHLGSRMSRIVRIGVGALVEGDCGIR